MSGVNKAMEDKLKRIKKESLMKIIQMSKQGHAAISREGEIVDIREYPEATRIRTK